MLLSEIPFTKQELINGALSFKQYPQKHWWEIWRRNAFYVSSLEGFLSLEMLDFGNNASLEQNGSNICKPC